MRVHRAAAVEEKLDLTNDCTRVGGIDERVALTFCEDSIVSGLGSS